LVPTAIVQLLVLLGLSAALAVEYTTVKALVVGQVCLIVLLGIAVGASSFGSRVQHGQGTGRGRPGLPAVSGFMQH
jgi:hypothetical protein